MAHVTRAACRPSSGSAHRRRRRRVRLIAGASLVGLILGAGCSATGESAVDKAGGTVTSAPLDLRVANTRGYEADPFLERVVKLSGGQITLTADVKLGQPTLTSEPEALRAVRAGQVDIAIVPTRSFDAVGVKTFDALMDPMVVDSLALQDKVLADPVASDMLNGLASSGLVGIGVLPGPIRLPNGITRRMLGPATYAGARIAINASPISERALKALGAVPVESAFDGADVAGFDGLEQQASSIAGNQYDGVVRWMTTNVGLWPRPVAIVAGTGAWGRLTDTQRGWLVQAAKGAMSDPTSRRSDVVDIGNMCRRGRIAMVSASAGEISQLRRALAPVDRWLRSDGTTAGYLDRIQTVKKRLGDTQSGQLVDCAKLSHGPKQTQSPAPAPASPLPSPVPAGPASKIDGNYAMLTNAKELAAAGASPGEVNPANWGNMRWVFDRGRFASTQFASTSDGRTCTWNYGTYAIHDGQVLRLTVLGGGGSDGGNKPGEVFDYTFSTYHDTMKWSPVAGATSPVPWMVKPFRRQPTKPWTEFLERECLPPVGWDG
jgi:TRAP-type C4-dicarboxylate transport system substrate-binding protein